MASRLSLKVEVINCVEPATGPSMFNGLVNAKIVEKKNNKMIIGLPVCEDEAPMQLLPRKNKPRKSG
jgi:hypothetical protein